LRRQRFPTKRRARSIAHLARALNAYGIHRPPESLHRCCYGQEFVVVNGTQTQRTCLTHGIRKRVDQLGETR
jgi:hypothetical protein